MSPVIEYLYKFFRILKKNFLVFIFSFLILIYFLFPFGDIADLVSSKVLEATNQKIQLQFSNMDISLIPVGLNLEQIHMKSSLAPEISCEKIQIRPSLLSLPSILSQKKSLPLGQIYIEKIFNGDVDLKLSSAKASEKVDQRYKLDFQAQNLNLLEFKRVFQLPLELEGSLSLNGILNFDPAFSEAPDGSLNLNSRPLSLSSLSIPTPLGPLPLPSLRFQQISAAGKFSEGQLNIESFTFGEPQDDFSGTLKGYVKINLQANNPSQRVQFGAYSFEVQIHAKPNFISKVSTLLDILNGMIPPGSQKNSATGTEYRMKLTGSRFGPPPHMEALH